MKKNKFVLKINHPCSENWETFSTNNNGRFCTNCSKTVIDFTNLSDDAIGKILSNQSRADKICGRFNKTQLNRVIAANSTEGRSVKIAQIVTGIFLLGFNQAVLTYEVKAAEFKKLPLVVNVLNKDNHQHKNLNDPIIDTTKHYIKGRIIDEKLNAVCASVSIKETGISVTSNERGRFKLFIPQSYTKDAITIEIRSVGYQTKECHFLRKNLPIKTKMIINSDDEVLMGDVVIIKNDD